MPGPAPCPPPAVLIQPRRIRPLKILWMLAVLLFVYYHTARVRPARGARAAEFPWRAEGFTMGTVYHLTVADRGLTENAAAALRATVEAALREVNRQMSVYDPASEISRVNAAGAGEPVDISPEFAAALRRALELAAATGGAYDPTVLPLVNLWGFGPRGRREQPPTAEEIAAARARVGYDRIVLEDGNRVIKRNAETMLDLASIAKGHGAEAVAETLRAAGRTNVLIEIGGEVVARGVGPGGEPWKIGVEEPRLAAGMGERLRGAVRLSDAALATSGDYRNFFTDAAGAVQAHILDPRRGEPVRRPVGGVTVFAPDGALADGLATALFVLGPEEGLPWLARAYPRAQAFFLTQTPDGGWAERASPGWESMFTRFPASGTGESQNRESH